MNLTVVPRMAACRAVSALRIVMYAVVIQFGVPGSIALGAPFTEIVLPFTSERPYSASYDANDNSVQLEILKTSTAELGPLERYDEELVRRLLVKDRGPEGVEIRMKLKDRDVVATIADFSEPFRIVISIFKKGYQPATGRDGVPLTAIEGDTSREHSTVASESSHSPVDGGTIPGKASAGDLKTQSSATPEARRFFQKAPARFENAGDLCARIQRAAPGTGQNWRNLEDPIYRLDVIAGEQKLSGMIPGSRCERAMKSPGGLADFAEELFVDGQELRALTIYQQMLFYDPITIERNPANLWRLAEIHLGQGNISLAAGYYDVLTSRFPGSPFHPLAMLRAADVAAIESAASPQTPGGKAQSLVQSLRSQKGDADWMAGVILRAAYWRQAAAASEQQLPRLAETELRELQASVDSVRHPRTRFLARSLLLNEKLADGIDWRPETGKEAALYFRDYRTGEFEPQRSILSSRLKERIATTLQQLSLDGRHVDAIQDFESLPKSLQSIRKNPTTAWALAESYRGIGQPQPAVDHYETAASGMRGVDRFKAQFWVAQTAHETAELMARTKSGATRVSAYRRKSVEADRAMSASWKGLKQDEREQLYASFRLPLEASLVTPARLRTPPKVILESWRGANSTRQSATAGDVPKNTATEFAPGASSANLASTLAARFGVLGMEKERREALGFMRSMKPSEFGSDQDAKKAWMDQLLKLGEEYRKDNEYLEAGRIFSQVATESADWEGRAETLYKAGLLLYRAGRKEEAIAALEKAKSDGNNLFYANLATERLNQITKK